MSVVSIVFQYRSPLNFSLVDSLFFRIPYFNLDFFLIWRPWKFAALGPGPCGPCVNTAMPLCTAILMSSVGILVFWDVSLVDRFWAFKAANQWNDRAVENSDFAVATFLIQSDYVTEVILAFTFEQWKSILKHNLYVFLYVSTLLKQFLIVQLVYHIFSYWKQILNVFMYCHMTVRIPAFEKQWIRTTPTMQ